MQNENSARLQQQDGRQKNNNIERITQRGVMWVCNRCECTFPEPDLTRDHGEKYNTCPICMSRDIKETHVCYSCGNATDNYGICDECRDIIIKDFKTWFEEEMSLQHVRMDDLIECINEYLEKL